MIEKINNDLKSSMKDQDKFSLGVLRMLKSALQLESINKKEELTEEEAIAVIKKQVKMRTDSIVEFEKFNKTEEVENLQKEIAFLKNYLPEELSEEEVDKCIEEAFSKIAPTSLKDMGQVMKELQPIATRTDMSKVSKKVKDKIMSL